MQALAAAGFDESLQAQLIKYRQSQLGRFQHGFPGQGRVRIEIEHEQVGRFNLVCGSAPGVKLDRTHLHRADQGFHAVYFHQARMAWIQRRVQLLDVGDCHAL